MPGIIICQECITRYHKLARVHYQVS
jgi:hypothetical protein